MPTEDDWKLRMAQRTKEAMAKRTINTAYLQQAAVESELLTNHPAWDTYLQRLQVRLNDAEANLKTWHEKIVTAHSESDLRQVQGQILIWSASISTLKDCMDLPKEILSHAHESLDNASK